MRTRRPTRQRKTRRRTGKTEVGQEEEEERVVEEELLLEEGKVDRTSLELEEEEERPWKLRRARRSEGEDCSRRCTFGSSIGFHHRWFDVVVEEEEVVELVVGGRWKREGVGFRLPRVDLRWTAGLERRRREGQREEG